MLHQLACVTEIRKQINFEDDPDVTKMLDETMIVSLIRQILSFDHTEDDLIYFMKQEALWILINLCFGTQDDITSIFELD